jgi:hypothetical protein
MWVARGGIGLTSQGIRDVEAYLTGRALNNIYPFDHETGHMFGLDHADDTVNCLSSFNIHVEQEDSFMTQQQPRNTIAEYEKRMLIDDSYGKECLRTLGERPHSSKYLSVCTNNPNINGISIEDLSMLLASWGACPYVLCPADFNCDTVVNIDDLANLIVNWR